MYFSLERLEDTVAVLQNDHEETVVVDRSLLPPQAKAGEVFRFCDGQYRYDDAETAARKERIYRLEQLLRRNKR